MDMIFSLRQQEEKCFEQQLPPYQVFVDLAKARYSEIARWMNLKGSISDPRVLKSRNFSEQMIDFITNTEENLLWIMNQLSAKFLD